MFAENSILFDESDQDSAFFSTPSIATILEADEKPTPRKIDFALRPPRDWHDVGASTKTVPAPTNLPDIAPLLNISTTISKEDPFVDKVFSYIARVEKLRAFVTQEGSVLNQGSEYDFWLFVLKEFEIRRGNVVVTHNGNLRLVWKDSLGTHLGLQFLGGEEVQFVIFKRRGTSRVTSRVAGRDTIEGVKNQISSFELNTLLYEQEV
ncbi:MAG: hypothetical protein F4077_04705 [Gammaproteobacteria bacterium]|nr:hypothetical protein [Gammaproteobacteria bacterium]MYI77047.1 hypothetical protein [Gammaproteobacteria bacterium]